MNTHTLLTVPELLSRGYALYRKNLSTLVSLGALIIGLIYLGVAAFIGSFQLLAIYAAYVGIYGFLLLTAVALGIIALVVWLLMRLILSMFYTIRNHDHLLTLREAFGRSRGRAREFLWLLVLYVLINTGAVVFMLFLDSVVVFPFWFVNSSFLVDTAEMVVLIASLFVLLAVASWLIFAPWFFVDKGARGMHAVTLSKHLSHHHLGAIMWRLFCILVVYGIAMFVSAYLLTFVLTAFSPIGGALTAFLLTMVLAALVFKPLIYCTFYVFYKNADETHVIDTESRAHGEHYGVLIALATLGFLALCALPSFLSLSTSLTGM